MSDYHAKRAAQKAELSKLSEADLRGRWQQNDYSLWSMEKEAGRRGYSNPGDDYFGSDLSEENELINEILRGRGLSEEERPPEGEGDEQE